MFFSWVTCFLWTSILHSSYQGPGRSYSAIQDNFSPMAYPRSCACPDKDGKMYNLEILGSKDKRKPRFTEKSDKYKGYAYTYNPCSPFHLGPKNTGCQGNVAICWWVPNLNQSADTYKAIGIQNGAKCGLDDQDKMPVVKYQASEEFPNRTSTVRLKCAEGKENNPTFEIVDENNWKFQVTYSWASCPKSMQDPQSSTGASAIVEYAVGGVLAFTALPVLICAVRYFWRKRNENNDNGERRRILGNEGVDQHANVFHNPIGQIRSQPIGSSHAKADVNVLGGVHS